MLSTRLPPLPRLLIDKLALTERIGASCRIRPQRSSCRRLQSCILWRRHGRAPGEGVGPRALRLKRLWRLLLLLRLKIRWKLRNLFRGPRIGLCHGKALREWVGVLPLQRGRRERRSTGSLAEHYRLPERICRCGRRRLLLLLILHGWLLLRRELGNSILRNRRQIGLIPIWLWLRGVSPESCASRCGLERLWWRLPERLSGGLLLNLLRESSVGIWLPVPRDLRLLISRLLGIEGLLRLLLEARLLVLHRV